MSTVVDPVVLRPFRSGPEDYPGMAAANQRSRDAAGIEAFQKLFGKRAEKGYVVCLCRERFPLTRSVDAVPLGAF